VSIERYGKPQMHVASALSLSQDMKVFTPRNHAYYARYALRNTRRCLSKGLFSIRNSRSSKPNLKPSPSKYKNQRPIQNLLPILCASFRLPQTPETLPSSLNLEPSPLPSSQKIRPSLSVSHPVSRSLPPSPSPSPP
jgi:hypothetical protein